MSIFAHIFSTEYSNEEAFGKLDKENKAMIQAWAEHAKESGDPEPTLILADKFSATAQIPFFNACNEYNVKPVFGVKAVIQGANGADNHEVILVAKNDDGRQNINKIITEAYIVTPQKGYKLITREHLEAYKDGLICISGGQDGLVEKAMAQDNYDQAKKIALYFKKIFNDNFYMQVRRTSNDLEGQALENKIIEMSKRLYAETGIKMVANNDVRFVKKEDYPYHLMRKDIINKGLSYNPAKKVNETENQYLLPLAHMMELFKDIPESIYNMGELVDATDMSSYKSRLGKSHLPKFPIPEQFNDDPVAYLTHITEVGFVERWKKISAGYRKIMGSKTKDGSIVNEDYITHQEKFYRDRIAFELETIKNTGFAGYFLIVHELIHWCRNNGVAVGPGRGSGAGSLVLYSLTITNVDPIPYDLLFERFMNPERMSEPDIDIDFSPRNRERAIQHMKDLYGAENTAQILTEGTMAARSVIDSIARIQGMKPEESDRVKSLVSDELGTTIAKEMETNEQLQELFKKSRQVRRLIIAALKLEKSVVSYGKHAGGVVVSLGPMHIYGPLYREEGKDSPVVQFNKDMCEKVGLIKFDILGLKNLDIIDDCTDNINENLPEDKKLIIDDIPLDDPLTINLFKNADTYGIFQFESNGMRALMKDLSPDNIDELIALVALFRPGPLQSKMDKDFIERKFNESKIVYPHPRLQKTLKTTYGTTIYQEQVMEIARVMADYTLGQADILRKAMGKKDMEIMRKQRAMFLEGCMNSFRQETLKNTGERMKAPHNPNEKIAVDLSFENIPDCHIKTLLESSGFKFSNIDQVVHVLKHYGDISDDELTLFKLEVDGMDDKHYYGRFYNTLIAKGVPKLQAEGLSVDEANKVMASVGVASSMFVRFNKIFALMHKFAAYGFNKSHSVAYALVSFQTAYLKAHYPSQYMASMLTNESNIENVAATLAESRRMGLNVMQPNINTCGAIFKAASGDSREKNIVYGLAQIKGINKTVPHIVDIIKKTGQVKDIFDFYDKFGNYKIVDVNEKADGTVKTNNKTLIGKAILNNLLNAGALDCICPNKDPKYRATLQATYHFLTELVTDIEKRINFNNREIAKHLKIYLKPAELTSYMDNIVSEMKEKYNIENVFEPENISVMNADALNEAYKKISDFIADSIANLPPVKKKVKDFELKEIHDYHKEIEIYQPVVKKSTAEKAAEADDVDSESENVNQSEIKKIKIEHDGKTFTYIEPTTANYADVPEYGSKETAFIEYELTGMYQTVNPVTVGSLKEILASKEIVCASSRDLAQQVETFGKLNEKTGRKYYQAYYAGTIVELKDFKRTNNDTGEAYTDITALVDDGFGIVTVKFKAEQVFAAGKEMRCLNMLKDMMKKEVVIFEGSASTGRYESAGATIFAKRIGSTNPEFYLPLEDPSLNFVEGEKEKMIVKKGNDDLATTAQIDKLASLLKRNNVAYTEVFSQHNIQDLNELTKDSASKLIQKYMGNNKPSNRQ